MSKFPDKIASSSSGKQSESIARPVGSSAQPISNKDYIALAGYLGGRESAHRVQKKDSHTEALCRSGDLYEKREFVSAYECFKAVYDKVVSDMQRVLARNLEFEANKLAREQRKPLAAAKETVQRMKTQAQQVVDQFDRLLRDLQSKPLVRIHIKKGTATGPIAVRQEEAPPTTVGSANETRLDTNTIPPFEAASGGRRYRKVPYAPPEVGALYSVRDRTSGERVIRIIGKSPDGSLVQVETPESEKASNQPIELPVGSLARQAAKGWCHLLIPMTQSQAASHSASPPAALDAAANVTMRLDSQNFGRCCADIVRANIKFGTQPIKDVGDGPFRAGNYEQAFLTFEQLAVGFNSAVANSRRTIADGRRALTAEKGNLSGKEIQERTAAFIRSEQLIHTAEREFATILEGLRMYLRAQQTTSEAAPPDIDAKPRS